jgi:hypothetical protein
MLPWRGEVPFGAMAAAAAAAAEGVRAAVPIVAEHLGRPAPNDVRWRRLPNRQVGIDLARYRISHGTALGEVDVVSGGAITQAALYALLRTPGLSASLRVIEPDRLGTSNLNRYALALRSMLTWPKTQVLTRFATDSVKITGNGVSFNDMTATILNPMASQILVGVDHCQRSD